jgi:hypothetical protein
MHFRHGLEWRSTVTGGAFCVLCPFVVNGTQKAGVQFTANTIRILQDGDPVVRASVSTAISGGDFASLTGWTDVSSGGGSVFGVTELANEIMAARGVKPIVSVVNSMAASATRKAPAESRACI